MIYLLGNFASEVPIPGSGISSSRIAQRVFFVFAGLLLAASCSFAVPLDSKPAPLVLAIFAQFVDPVPENAGQIQSDLIARSGLTRGVPCSFVAMQRAVRAVFAKGDVSDVCIKALPAKDGLELIIVAQMNPVVRQINFIGFSAAQQTALQPLISTRQGARASEFMVFTDANRLTAELAKDNVDLAATGTLVITDVAHNSATVTFTGSNVHHEP